MSKISGFLAALLLAASLSPAQAQHVYHDGYTAVDPVVPMIGCSATGVCTGPLSATNPMPVSGTFTATLGGFTPSAAGARMTQLNVSTSDSTATLPTGVVTVVSNTGSNPMYCNVNGIAATASDQLIPLSSWFAFTIPVAVTTLHCIATGGSTTADGLGGAGLPTGAGGGGGGGAGGSNASVAATAGPVPAFGTYLGMNVAGNLTGVAGTANGLKVDGSAVTQPVSATSLPLPTGAATSALQTTGNTSLATLATNSAALGQAAMAASAPVVIASNQSAVPASESGTWNITNVSGTVSLPTGAATSALQTSGNTSLTTIASGTPALGQATASASVPSVLASDQMGSLLGGTAGSASLAAGGVYQSTAPTLTTGQQAALLLGQRGALQVLQTINGSAVASAAGASSATTPRVVAAQDVTTIAGSAPGTAGTASANVLTVQGVTSMTPVQVSQATAANLNATVVNAGTFATQLTGATNNINNIAGTVSLPTGASTSALQPTNAAQGSTTSGQTGSLVQGAVTTAAPTYVTAQTSPLSLDTTGALRVNVTAGGGTGGTSSNFGSAFPGPGTAVGFHNVGGNMDYASVDGSHNLDINCVVGCAGGTFNNNADAVATSATNGQTAAWLYGFNGTTWDRLRDDANKFLEVTVANTTLAVTQSGSWSLAANQSVNTAQVNGITTLTGAGATGTGAQRETVSQDTTTIAGSAPGTAGAASANVVTVQGVASMTPLLANPGTAANWGVGATGSAVPANDVYIGVNVAGTNRGLTAVNPSGVVYAAQTDVTSVNGVTALTGTGAVGTGAQRVAVGVDAATVAGSAPGTAGTPSTNVVSVQGVASGTVVPISGAVSQSGNWTARVVGNGGATLDIAQGGATAATNALQVGGVFNTVLPTLTTGQGGAAQLDSSGRLLVDMTACGSSVCNPNGSAVSASSSPVVIASDQSAVAIKAANSAFVAGALVDIINLTGTKAAGTAAANSLLAGSVYNSTPITLANGNQAALQGDANGYLNVHIQAGAGSGGTAVADNSAFTQSTTSETPIGCLYNTGYAGATSGRSTIARCDVSGQLIVSGTATMAQGTGPTNGVGVLGEYLSAPPTLTNGQSQGLLLDSTGKLSVTLGVSDLTPSTVNITAADAASTTAAWANSQTAVTGTPTANSAASFALAPGVEALGVQASGTFNATVATELSMDGGTNWFSVPVYQDGIVGGHATFTGSGVTANFAGYVNTGRATNFRVRATSYTSGTATIKVVTSINQAMAAAMPPLSTGTATIGALTANQSVNVAQINAVTPLMGNGTTGTGSQRVTIASDNTAFQIKATGNAGASFDAATGAAPPANILYAGVNESGATGGHVAGIINCDNHVFKHITSATDTLAVQGVASQTIYICQWRSRAAGVATWFLENTASANANCSSANTQITGVATEAANTGETFGTSFWGGLKNTSGNGLCINSTGTGGEDLDIWYAQF